MSDPLGDAAHPAPDAQDAAPSRWRVDPTPLRTLPDFRRLWTSGLVTYVGSVATYVALPFQVAELTGSVLLAGLLGAAEVVPMIAFGLWGGALADAVDRRKMVVVTEGCLLVLTGLLLLNALLDEPLVWPLFVVSALFAVADSLQRPSLDSMVAAIVPNRLMSAASAWQSIRYQVGAIGAPALTGVLLATVGTWSAYALDVATTLVSLALLLRVRHVSTPSAEVAGFSGIREGIAYAWSRKDLLGTYAIDVAAMVFGMSVALYPFLVMVLEAPWALGLLYSAESLGALLVSLTSGWTSRIHRHGRAIAYAAALYGLAMLGVGLAPGVWWAVVALAVAGGADMVSGIFRTTMWNQSVPMSLRGRLAGIELLSYSTGPVLGNARAGTVASLTSVRTALVTGGVLCTGLTLGLLAVLGPLRRYDATTDPHAAARRAEEVAD